MSEINSSTFEYVVKNINPHLSCEICKLPVHEGIYHSYCRRFRCKKCDEYVVPHLCDNSSSVWYPMINDEFMSQILDNLQIYCSNRKNGCIEIMPRAKYSEHLNTCNYNLIKCLNCEIEIKKINFERHMGFECPKRTVTCQYCSVSGPIEIIQKHLVDISLCQGLDKVLLFLKHPMVISVLEKTLGKRKASERSEQNERSQNSNSKKPRKAEKTLKYIKYPINIVSVFGDFCASFDDLTKVVSRPSEEVILQNFGIKFLYDEDSNRYLSRYHLQRWMNTLSDNQYRTWIQEVLIPSLNEENEVDEESLNDVNNVNEINEVNTEALSDDEKIAIENLSNGLRDENMINYSFDLDTKSLCAIIGNFFNVLYQQNKNIIIGKNKESIIEYIERHLSGEALEIWNTKKYRDPISFSKHFSAGMSRSKYRFMDKKCAFRI
jgi:hypothetical protein